ncbi:MAG: 16S rRNA (guanine(966)-N(2))-methyltransferase RsmD [Nocardioides sp.]|nr:16S rRNA (guanine(966)-N(2))-methyltransferase RsmD [Nocardioides sp.]
MTRIIGGAVGGRRLATPKGHATRPTSDRVREALFSAIESWSGSLSGLRFLDLYAGSGAVGLEARSRGTAAVTLVEQDRRTCALIRDNARDLGLAHVEVVAASVATTLSRTPTTPYDVVFLDPPYPLPDADVDAVLQLLVDHDWLAPGALIIAERASKRSTLTWPAGVEAGREKKYGESLLRYGHAAAVSGGEATEATDQ